MYGYLHFNIARDTVQRGLNPHTNVYVTPTTLVFFGPRTPPQTRRLRIRFLYCVCENSASALHAVRPDPKKTLKNTLPRTESILFSKKLISLIFFGSRT